MYLIKYLYQIFFMPPGFIMVLLLIFSFWTFRKKKMPKLSMVVLAFTLLIYICSIPLVGDGLLHKLELRYSPPSKPEGDVIIMLGGGATLDTPNVASIGHLSGNAANRMLTCAQLYRKLGIPILVSSGQVYETTGTEAEIAKSILVGLGVPEDKIIIDNRSLNTTQNAQNAKEIIQEKGFKKPILVTSAFHMDRSVRQFRKVELSVIPFPTDYHTNIKFRVELHDFVPSGEAMMRTNMALKEYLGIVASRWY